MYAKITITNDCNARCKTCLVNGLPRPRFKMDKDKFKLVVDKCDALGLDCLHMYNIGESYLHPDHMEMFEYGISKFGHRTVIITNGELVDELPSGIGTFIISFNGGRKDEYEYTTGLDFEKTRDNIFRLYESGELAKVVHTAEIHMLSIPGNRHTEDDFARLFSPLTDVVSLRVSRKYDNQCGFLYLDGRPRKPCDYLDVLNIHYDCGVVMCAHDFRGDNKWGDILEDPLWKIMNHPDRINKICEHKHGKYGGICEHCNYNVLDGKQDVGYIAGPRSV